MTALVIGGAVLFALLALGVWARRGELKPDPPGVRTLCTFSSEDDDGARLLTGLAAELRMRGAVTDEPTEDAEFVWALGVKYEGGDDSLQLVAVEAEGYAWVLTAVDRASGGPCSRVILPALAAALSSLTARDVSWHRRELFTRGDLGSARPDPLD